MIPSEEKRGNYEWGTASLSLVPRVEWVALWSSLALNSAIRCALLFGFVLFGRYLVHEVRVRYRTLVKVAKKCCGFEEWNYYVSQLQ